MAYIGERTRAILYGIGMNVYYAECMAPLKQREIKSPRNRGRTSTATSTFSVTIDNVKTRINAGIASITSPIANPSAAATMLTIDAATDLSIAPTSSLADQSAVPFSTLSQTAKTKLTAALEFIFLQAKELEVFK
jgi:hypothetical protein